MKLSYSCKMSGFWGLHRGEHWIYCLVGCNVDRCQCSQWTCCHHLIRERWGWSAKIQGATSGKIELLAIGWSSLTSWTEHQGSGPVLPLFVCWFGGNHVQPFNHSSLSDVEVNAWSHTSSFPIRFCGSNAGLLNVKDNFIVRTFTIFTLVTLKIAGYSGVTQQYLLETVISEESAALLLGYSDEYTSHDTRLLSPRLPFTVTHTWPADIGVISLLCSFKKLIAVALCVKVSNTSRQNYLVFCVTATCRKVNPGRTSFLGISWKLCWFETFHRKRVITNVVLCSRLCLEYCGWVV